MTSNTLSGLLENAAAFITQVFVLKRLLHIPAGS
jgi:hypothetical protein